MSIEEEDRWHRDNLDKLSSEVFHNAYLMHLANGYAVTIGKDGFIWKVFPEGFRIKIKEIEKPFHLPIGTKIKI